MGDMDSLTNTVDRGCDVERSYRPPSQNTHRNAINHTVTAPSYNYVHVFSGMCEEANTWIKRAEDLSMSMTHIDDTGARHRFEEFLRGLNRLVLSQVKSAAQQYIDCVNFLRKNKRTSTELFLDLSDNFKNTVDSEAAVVKLDLSTKSRQETPQPFCPELTVLNLKTEPKPDTSATIENTSLADENVDTAIEHSDTEAADESKVHSDTEAADESKEANFQCDICPEAFTSQEGLAGHTDIAHTNYGNPLVCVECNEGFMDEKCFVKHIQSHPGVSTDVCMLCSESFPARVAMLRHLREHLAFFKCDVCHKSFGNKRVCRLHRKSHKPYQCKICFKRFVEKTTCDGHELKHDPKTDSKCDECSMTFIMWTDLKHHIEQTHADIQYCEFCAKPFESGELLAKHNCIQKREKRYQCWRCQKQFKSKLGLGKNHINKKTPCFFLEPEEDLENDAIEINTEADTAEMQDSAADAAVQSTSSKTPSSATSKDSETQAEPPKMTINHGIQCVVCPEKFQSKREYDTHYTSRHFFGKKPLQCPKCDVVFDRVFTFRMHVQDAHAEHPSDICMLCGKRMKDMPSHLHAKHLYLYKCDLCPKQYGERYDLKVHRQGHDKIYAYQCSYCGKQYRSKKPCDIHELVAHGEEFKYACTVCGEEFKAEYHLRYHTDTKHPASSIVCEHCGKAFPTKRLMENHMFVHEKHDRFQCAVCKKCFQYAHILRRHEASSHGRTEGKWHCTVCDKVVLRARKESHLRAHSGDRPYVCKVCNKSYAWSGLLREHMHIHTGETPYKCNICGKIWHNSANLSKHMKSHRKKGQC